MASRTAVLDRVERLLRAGLTAKAYRERVLAELRPVLRVRRPRLAADRPADPGGDLAAGRRARPGPARPAEPRPAALPHHRQPLDDLARRGPARRDAARRDRRRAGPVAAVARVPGRARGHRRGASVVCADRFGCWAWLDLWRTGTAYAPADAAFLAELAPGPHRRPRARRRRGRSSTTPRGSTCPGRRSIVLGPDLAVRSQTVWAGEALLRLNPPDEPVPTDPGRGLQRRRRPPRRGGRGARWVSRWSRVHLGEGRWVTLRADRMTPRAEETRETSWSPSR